MTETSAKIIADSISPAGHRLTTFEAVYPRIVLAEVNTHRLLSRVSASSRAVPVEKMVRRVLEDPYVPTHWGKNQKGMQAEEELSEGEQTVATSWWLGARDKAVESARALLAVGVHKQITNRLIEPFMWHPTVISATEWSNFFNLRDHTAAHPDFRDLAHAMRELYGKSEPRQLGSNEWHMPYIGPEDCGDEVLADVNAAYEKQNMLCKVSVGRCARVSSLTHDGKYDLSADVGLHDKMHAGGHMSPYENVARPMTPDELELFEQKKLRWHHEHGWYWVGAQWSDGRLHAEERWMGNRKAVWTLVAPGEYTHFLGNVQGWVTLRKMIPHEEDILGART